MKTELLAPAKNKEIAFAAIDCGADAVYIGASAYGARQSASNTLEDIKDVVDYAHKFWAKVFVTVNTILTDTELIDALRLVKELDKIGVDALIIQDMGLLNKIMELNLDIPIHISTQCDNRDAEKIKFWNSLGVSRVVLARELSLEQIGKIHNENPNLELECFVHGALCVSYSGQCYLSQYIGGRSANRGECAQPCRKRYTVIDNKGNDVRKNFYPLCLKDFNASNHIKRMIEAGVYSFKIEGRLKDINYVKNIVSYYRQELDKYSDKSSSGISSHTFTPNPEKSFNRGFTDYFLEGRKECYNLSSPKSIGEYVGKISEIRKENIIISTDKKLNPQDGLCFIGKNGLEGFLINKFENNIVFPNKMPKLLHKGQKIFRNQDVEFDRELSKPCKRKIGLKVNVSNGLIKIIDEDCVTIDAKLPQGDMPRDQIKMNNTFIKQFSKTGESDFYIDDIKIDENLSFMPVSEINKLRRDCFEKLIIKRLKEYKRLVQAHLNYAKYYKDEVDYRANVHNNEAKTFYEKCGCKVNEMSLETKIPQRQIELMRTKHCIKYALNMCKSPIKLFLKDEKNVIYPLLFDCKKCEMAVLSENYQ